MKKLGILVSGRGSNMQAIMDACDQGRLSATVAIVISNNKDADALQIANSRNIDTAHLSSRTHPDPGDLDKAMNATLCHHQVDYVLLAGFMKKIGPETIAQFKGKIINIHPALLPKHGGQGMYGLHVHESVIASKDKETGVTIHLVDGEYDEGAILAQESIPISSSDSATELAARVLKLEHRLYAETIQKIIDGSIILPTDTDQTEQES